MDYPPLICVVVFIIQNRALCPFKPKVILVVENGQLQVCHHVLSPFCVLAKELCFQLRFRRKRNSTDEWSLILQFYKTVQVCLVCMMHVVIADTEEPGI